MPIQLNRRAAAAALLALVPLAGCAGGGEPAASAPASAAPSASPPAAQPIDPAAFEPQFQQLESEYDALLGVYAVDTGTERTISYNADQRFAYASTFKALAVGAVLQQNTIEELEEVITYTSDDLVNHTPITEQHVDTGMTLRELCDAAIRYSDNTAANMLFEELGGPSGLDAALEGIGDDVTHVDRIEPHLSDYEPGDIRDTSTPQAMATSLRAYTLGEVLPPDERAILVDMLRGNTTGDELIRAGVPADWEVGDKTGSGSYGTRNDIAILWPPDREPIVVAIMTSNDDPDAEYDNALIADAATVIAQTMA
ncbi:class A beta-lactamase [Allonocardiopsis opalescens]|uniref:Beta-lactamase n=1 Tax=Allonocardiopsis opalescens TaxID=1144618 RepID=A0A2T0QEZ7_9ACTN|nr:class A beta-lactamase [Allonocardiopsis opalescens]PRY02423.1 beta-lactamase class A [Allonocardiopsis opalescens]